MYPGTTFEDYTGLYFWRTKKMSRQKLRLELDIAYFGAISKMFQIGRGISTGGSPLLAKIMPMHSLVQEVIR